MFQKKLVLPVIVFSQFCCTSLWFIGNAIIGDLINSFNLEPSALGNLTSAIQFGFITGTFLFAILTISDRFSPSKVFFISALIGAFFNVLMAFGSHSLLSLICIRFLIGFFLAGIYPVGMKIASDYYEKGLGKSLGFLVGALVLGTAFPHVLKEGLLFWKHILYLTSGLAILGGGMIFFLVPDGPYKKTMQKFDMSLCYQFFKIKKFKSAAFGYFGHMWELYAFWTFIPLFLKSYSELHKNVIFNIPLLSFYIICAGTLGCIISGYLSDMFTSKKVAKGILVLSCFCCLISSFVFALNAEVWFVIFLMFWGLVVVADSPIFSTLITENVPSESKGTALTIVSSIGFAITIVSIELLNYLQVIIEVKYLFLVLAIGPMFGIYGLCSKN